MSGPRNSIFLLYSKKSDGNIKIRVILQKDGTMRHTGRQIEFSSRKKNLKKEPLKVLSLPCLRHNLAEQDDHLLGTHMNKVFTRGLLESISFKFIIYIDIISLILFHQQNIITLFSKCCTAFLTWLTTDIFFIIILLMLEDFKALLKKIQSELLCKASSLSPNPESKRKREYKYIE